MGRAKARSCYDVAPRLLSCGLYRVASYPAQFKRPLLVVSTYAFVAVHCMPSPCAHLKHGARARSVPAALRRTPPRALLARETDFFSIYDDCRPMLNLCTCAVPHPRSLVLGPVKIALATVPPSARRCLCWIFGDAHNHFYICVCALRTLSTCCAHTPRDRAGGSVQHSWVPPAGDTPVRVSA